MEDEITHFGKTLDSIENKMEYSLKDCMGFIEQTVKNIKENYENFNQNMQLITSTVFTPQNLS